MFVLYPDTEKELKYKNYKPLPTLNNLNCTETIELLENLYSALCCTETYNADALSIALYDDIVIVQKHRIENYIRTVSSGQIALIIGNTQYTEIDIALMAAMKRLSKQYTEDDIFFDIGTDTGKLYNYIRTAYRQEKGDN